MKDISNKRSFITSLLGALLLVVFLFFSILSPTTLDDIFLLERIHPTYWKYLSSLRHETRYFPSSFRNLSEKEIYEKNILPRYSKNEGDYAGVEAKWDAGYFILNGKSHDNAWPNIVEYICDLDEGSYYISSGRLIKKSDVDIYLEGWKDGESTHICDVDQGCVFEVKEGEYDYYKLAIQIQDDRVINNETFKPLLCSVDNVDEEKYEIVTIDDETKRRISDKDWVYYLKLEKNVNIIFEDMNAIRIQDNGLSYGKCNIFGRLIE